VQRAQEPPFVLTVDVEPDWGIRGDQAVRDVLPRFCRLLDRYGTRATFFVVASLLDTCAGSLRQITERHEVASHGLTHRRLDRLPEREVERELRESRERLEDRLRISVTGFRAPFLRPAGDWFEKLAAAGYGYDSSMGSVWPSRRNVRPERWRIERMGKVAEVPVTTLRTGLVPFSLTYLRLLAPVGERLVSPAARTMFLHLHELADPPLAAVLRPPLRWVLRRRVGEEAWRMMERILGRVAPRAITCRELVEAERGRIS